MERISVNLRIKPEVVEKSKELAEATSRTLSLLAEMLLESYIAEKTPMSKKL